MTPIIRTFLLRTISPLSPSPAPRQPLNNDEDEDEDEDDGTVDGNGCFVRFYDVMDSPGQTGCG